MDYEHALLVLGLDGHEAHGRALHRFADRGRVGAVGLAALDIGFDVLRRHQPDLVAELADRPGPEMGRSAGLEPNQTTRQVGAEAEHRRPPQLPGHQDLALAVDAMDLKDGLAEIETNDAEGHAWRSGR